MVKNIKGGNKAKKGKNSGGKASRQVVFRTKSENYAKVVSNLGNGRLQIEVFNDDGSTSSAQGVIRGCIRKCKFIKDDMVLVCERDYEKGIYDVSVKYTLDNIQELIHSGEIPDMGMGSLFTKDYSEDIYSIPIDHDVSDSDDEEVADGDDIFESNPTKQRDGSSSESVSDAESGSASNSGSESEKRMSPSRDIELSKSAQTHLASIASKGRSSKSVKANIQAKRGAKQKVMNYEIDLDAL